MKRQLTITDLTRMQAGRVCVAGYDQDGRCVRPVLPPPGISENSLYQNGKPVVFPGARVEYDFTHPTPQPPHTEDYRYDPKAVRGLGRNEEPTWRAVLQQSLSADVEAIFEVPILTDLPGSSVMDGHGPRSLGTVQPGLIFEATYAVEAEGKNRYRLRFVDRADGLYALAVTDLTWRYYCDHEHKQGKTLAQITRELTRTLKSAAVYLRLGLARGWKQYPDRCFLQITGIYTFPDYAAGQTFADFAPQAK
ncbi:MAG: dual OB domain-containing protein [Anaerolineales bacterium]